MVSEWNSVVGEGGLGNCMSLSVLSQESSVVRQTWQKCSILRRDRGSSVLFVIWYTNFVTDCFYDTWWGPVIEKFDIVRPRLNCQGAFWL